MHISRWPKPANNLQYLGVRCRKCRKPIPFAVDRTGESKLTMPRKLVLTCVQAGCGHQDDYTNAKLSRFRKHQRASHDSK
jgi:hypothetical protein